MGTIGMSGGCDPGHRAHDPHLVRVAGEPLRSPDGRLGGGGRHRGHPRPVLVPLLIPLWPLPTMIAALVLDAVDQTVFQALAPDADLSWYQGYDKALDIYHLGIAYLRRSATGPTWRRSR